MSLTGGEGERDMVIWLLGSSWQCIPESTHGPVHSVFMESNQYTAGLVRKIEVVFFKNCFGIRMLSSSKLSNCPPNIIELRIIFPFLHNFVDVKMSSAHL